jgi:ABC-2 type transport system permease protein
MPEWLQGFAQNQPFTPIIETVRALLDGTDASRYGWLALAWLAGFLIAGYVTSMLLFRRRVAK